MKNNDTYGCEFSVWEESGIIKGEIRLPGVEEPLSELFQDLLSRNIKNSHDFEILYYETYPSEDNKYFIIKKESFTLAQNLYQENRNKSPSEREKILIPEFRNLASFETGEKHGYGWVYCYSKIHTKEQLIEEIKKIAQKLNIELFFFDLIKRKNEREQESKIIEIVLKVIFFIVLALVMNYVGAFFRQLWK